MSTNETRNQNNIAIIIVGDDTEVIDSTPGWEKPFTEHDRYDESTGHNYVRYPVYGAEVSDGETSTAFHRPTCRYE